MGSKSRQTENSSSTTQSTMDPWVSNAGQANYQAGVDAVNNWSPVMRETPAGFTSDQLLGQQLTRDSVNGSSQAVFNLARASANNAKLADNPIGTYTYKPYTTSDERMAQLMQPITGYHFASPQSILGSGPVEVGGGGWGGADPGSVADIKAQQIAAAKFARGDIRDVSTAATYDELQKYLDMIDPQYAKAVLDPAMADIERTRQKQLLSNADAAAASGAFGGSRHGVVEGETNRAALDAAARTSGDLRMGMFDKALASLQADLGRRLEADTSNQGMDYQTAMQNAQLLQQANIANQSADLEAQKGNQATQAQLATTRAQLAQQAGMQAASLRAQAAMQYQSLLAQLGLANENNRAQFARDQVNYGFEAEGDNQSALNHAGEYNAGALTNRDRYNADYLKSSITNDMDLGKTNEDIFRQGLKELLASGQQQQDYNQSVKDNTYNNTLATNMAPLTKVAMLQNFLSNSPYNTSVSNTSNGTTTVQNTPGAMDWAKLGMTVLSDERLKKDIKPMKNPLNSLRKMTGVDYRWKMGGKDSGLLAQDVGRAAPGATTETPSGALAYSVPKVLGLLTESVKQLDKKVSGKKKKMKAEAA